MFDHPVRDAGVARVCLHGLRHRPATILLATGLPVKTVSERLGHAQVQVTLDTYSHFMPGMQQAAVAVFAGAIRGL